MKLHIVVRVSFNPFQDGRHPANCLIKRSVPLSNSQLCNVVCQQAEKIISNHGTCPASSRYPLFLFFMKHVVGKNGKSNRRNDGYVSESGSLVIAGITQITIVGFWSLATCGANLVCGSVCNRLFFRV